ncbi:MAG: hypothetical protein HRT88_06065 [Lentisphaeraceae bacterium]|nr:hypothetical protein [Lentisphaeraceae bacterium]
MKNCLIALMMLMTFSVEAGTVQNDIKVIKAYVIKMNKRVKALETKVAKLENKLKTGPSESSLPATNRNNAPRQRQVRNNNEVEVDIPDPVQPRSTPPPAIPYFGKEANKTALLKIKAPRRWSERSVKDYLQEIKDASANQRSFSSRDYQVYLLKQIPMDYLETVLQYGASAHRLKLYIEYSVPPYIRQRDKATVLKYLSSFEVLVKSVVPRPSWHANAWPILLNGLRESNRLPDEWINLVASKDKNDGNRALLIYLQNAPSTNLIKAIQTTSAVKEDIKKSAFISWQKFQHADEWRKKNAAICAVYYGKKDALKHLISCNKLSSTSSYNKLSINTVLTQVVDFKDMSIIEWFEKYEAVIVFDETQMQFIAKAKS